MTPVRRRGDLHGATDRLDPELLAMLVDEGLQDLMRRSSFAWAKKRAGQLQDLVGLAQLRTSPSL